MTQPRDLRSDAEQAAGGDEEWKTARYFVPSPAEIAQVCAEIQAGWSDAERAKRWTGKPRVAVDGGREHRVGLEDE